MRSGAWGDSIRILDEALKKTNEHSDNAASLWEAPGSLRTCLLRLDGQVGAVVHAEKYVADSAVVSCELAGHLGRIAQQMGLGSGDGVVEQLGNAPGFEPVKPGFTREAGSFRRQVPPHGVGDPGERATGEQ